MAEGKVKIRVEGDTVHFEQSIDKVEAKTTKMSGVFAGIGGAIGGAVSVGIGQATQVMGQSMEKAADFNETLSKTSVLFGEDMVAGLEKWAETGATAFGQSKQTALDAAATFAVFGKSAGLTGDQLADFSKKNVQLASDLASFHNTKPEDAIFAIGAAMRGEAEPMRQYGVLLDAASIKAKAVSMGLVQTSVDTNVLSKKQEAAEKALRKYNEQVEKHGKDSQEAADANRDLEQAQGDLAKTMEGTVGELTNEQKVLAANQLILDQTADAQGDFARTSDGMANAQRAANAQWENMQIQLGEKLLPIKIALVNFIMNQLLPALQTLGGWVQDVGRWFNEHREVLLAVGIAVAAVLVPAFLAWAASAAAAAAATIVAIAPVVAIAAAIAALTLGIIWAYENWGWFKSAVDAVAHFMKNVLWPAMQAVGSWIANTLVPIIVSIATTIADITVKAWEMVTKVTGFFANLAGDIGRVIGGVSEAIQSPFKSAFNAIANLWNRTVGSISFNVPGWVPGIGGNGFSMPKIPTFANGGLAFSPMLAIVGDHRGGGAEIITPEAKMRQVVREEGGSGGFNIDTLVVNGGNRELVRELDFWWRTKR